MIDLLKSGCTHKQQQAKLNEVIKTINEGNTGEGASIIVDNALSATSENPVQNKIIDAEFKKVRDEMTAIAGSSGGPVFKDTIFIFDFSNAPNNLNATASSSKEGTLQWYSYDGEAISVTLPEIRYQIARFDEYDHTKANLRFYRDDTVLEEFEIWLANGYVEPTFSMSDIIKNTKTTLSLVGRDIYGKDFSVVMNLLISFPVYYGAGERATDIVSEGTNERVSSIKGKTRSVAIEDSAKYIWFITTEIIDDISSNGFSAGFVLYEHIVIGDATYNCYRSTYPIVPGTYTFDIK